MLTDTGVGWFCHPAPVGIDLSVSKGYWKSRQIPLSFFALLAAVSTRTMTSGKPTIEAQPYQVRLLMLTDFSAPRICGTADASCRSILCWEAQI